MTEDRRLNLGFSDRFVMEAELFPGYTLGRVIAQYSDLYKIATENTELLAEISGKLQYTAESHPDYPAVGDFVMLDRATDVHGNAIIHAILTRKSAFIRRSAGSERDSQVVATNIDTVFICMALNNDYNLRRLERYLSVAWDSGATPVIVLTKSDLCGDLATKLSEIEAIAFEADLVVTSSMTEAGYRAILKYLIPGQTVAFLGSSGVGKSTLINRLLGRDYQKTLTLRKKDRGKHATTRRELFQIPAGGAVIDTPGMRELGLDSANLAKTFIDVGELGESCRFSDCRHEHEPGCRIRKAIEEGLITEDRLSSYKKLKKEARYEGLNAKQIDKEKIKDMFSEFQGIKNARNFVKSKPKYKS